MPESLPKSPNTDTASAVGDDASPQAGQPPPGNSDLRSGDAGPRTAATATQQKSGWNLWEKLGVVICIPVLVLIWNMVMPRPEGKNSSIPNPPPGKPGTYAVVRAQLDSKRWVKTGLILTVRNVDGWFIALAKKHPELLKDSGFTLATLERYEKSGSAKAGDSANSARSEKMFEDWVLRHVAASKPAGQPDAAPAVLATWGVTQEELGRLLMLDAKPPSVVDTAKVAAWNAALLKWVAAAPGSLEGSSLDTMEALTTFLSQRGKPAYVRTEEEKILFKRWLESCQDMLRLNVAGRHFESIAPLRGMTRVISNPPGADSGDTWHTVLMPDVSPGTDDLDAWRAVVQTYGVECQAPISLSLLVPNASKTVERLSSYVNEGALANAQEFTLPARSKWMQALGWTAFLGVLWFLIVVAFTTDTLRESLQNGNVEITRWQDSPWSTSRVVFAWWLAICSAAFLYLWAMKGQLNVISGSAPMLLGISGGTLAAGGFLSASKALGRQAKSRGFLMDIISENGEAEVSRLQMVVWNGVLGLVFIWQTIADWVMPTFDSNLSALLGISASTYVGYKWTNQKQGSGNKADGNG